jgi:hypothetical protein
MAKSLSSELEKCVSSKDFVNFARKHGASVREKNHYFIKFRNGETTTLSRTPGRKTPLYKTLKLFKVIYKI